HTEFEVTPKGGTAQLVTITKAKKGKNPYKAHMGVVSFTSLTLFVGLMSNRMGVIYISWTVLTFMSALVIAINPTWPSIMVWLSEYSRTQIAGFKRQLNSPFAWNGSAQVNTNPLLALQAGHTDHALFHREENEHEALSILKRGRHVRVAASSAE
ncbi:MAG: hypothetical protein ABWX90_01760, partial [Candidatus Saccharimonadales bacterium]